MKQLFFAHMRTHRFSWRTAIALITTAFIIRALVFAFYIAPHHFYKQPDSVDYHAAALCMAKDNGMCRLDTGEPIFWRTPGYPIFLSFFYRFFGMPDIPFEANTHVQEAFLWVQLAFSCLIPFLLWWLATVMTRNPTIAILTAWISVFHPAFVLASMFLLSEGLALVFFYLFLIGFMSLVLVPPHPKKMGDRIALIALTALALSTYTWMRPMGEMIAWWSIILLAFCSAATWRRSLLTAAAFFVIFFASLAPWYIRNHGFTDEWFFCPTIGTYLNVFSVPKILRRTTGKPILECHEIARQKASVESRKKYLLLRGTGKYVSNSICKRVAYPIIAQHPGYFAYDWLMETIKTTFDLYSYQFVSMANSSYFYDPIEEFLPDKLAACLYREPLSIPARIISWLELFWQIFLWIGLIGGLITFVLYPSPYRRVWLISISLIGLAIGMTGGFGYARLRLPVEPLMIILSLTFFIRKSYKEIP